MASAAIPCRTPTHPAQTSGPCVLRFCWATGFRRTRWRSRQRARIGMAGDECAPELEKPAQLRPKNCCLLLCISLEQRNEEKTVGRGKVEIQKQDSHFPTAQNACGARKKRPFTQNA